MFRHRDAADGFSGGFSQTTQMFGAKTRGIMFPHQTTKTKSSQRRSPDKNVPQFPRTTKPNTTKNLLNTGKWVLMQEPHIKWLTRVRDNFYKANASNFFRNRKWCVLFAFSRGNPTMLTPMGNDRLHLEFPELREAAQPDVLIPFCRHPKYTLMHLRQVH